MFNIKFSKCKNYYVVVPIRVIQLNFLVLKIFNFLHKSNSKNNIQLFAGLSSTFIQYSIIYSAILYFQFILVVHVQQTSFRKSTSSLKSVSR